jgi:hypothetical protein
MWHVRAKSHHHDHGQSQGLQIFFSQNSETMRTNVQQVYLVCRDSVIQQKTTANRKIKIMKHINKKKHLNSQKKTLIW